MERILFIVSYFVASATCSSSQCKTFTRDLTLEQQQPRGVRLFVSQTHSMISCSLICAQHSSCLLFSYQQDVGSCYGYNSFAVRSLVSTNVEDIPIPIFHRGIERIYTVARSLTVLVDGTYTGYSNAQNICSQEGLRMLILDSVGKANDILEIMGPELNWVWLGTSDAVNEGTWLWNNGGQLLPNSSPIYVEFDNYDGGATGTDQYNADCAVLRTTGPLIYDINCNRVAMAVCEKFD